MTGAFVDGYDVVLFDLDGVLYLGPVAVEGAVPGVHALRARGVRTAFVTNNAARANDEVAAHLIRLGLDVTPDEVVTSAQAASTMLAGALPAGSRVLVSGTANLVNQVELAGMVPVFRASDEPDAVIQGYDPELSWDMISQVSLAVQRGARWFATNTDRTRPTDQGLTPGVGAMIAAVAMTTRGDLEPEVAGKPYRPLFRETILRTGARHPLFVGDRLDTDILGACNSGMDSFMVFTGSHGVGDLCAAPEDSRPTAIGWNVASVLEPRREATLEPDAVRCGEATVRAVNGTAEFAGPIRAEREAQLDAAWALATLVWSGAASSYDAAAAELDLLP